MTSPPEKITIKCPDCGHVYEDWWRPSINLMIDDFDEAYITDATSSVCPVCGFRVQHGGLVVGKDGVFNVEGN
ncbi:MAG: CpXC domain-containing protein [Phycisphaerales bacterium]|nr:CpXC domain-containing protein [Phycisphaerales bacterium]